MILIINYEYRNYFAVYVADVQKRGTLKSLKEDYANGQLV